MSDKIPNNVQVAKKCYKTMTYNCNSKTCYELQNVSCNTEKNTGDKKCFMKNSCGVSGKCVSLSKTVCLNDSDKVKKLIDKLNIECEPLKKDGLNEKVHIIQHLLKRSDAISKSKEDNNADKLLELQYIYHIMKEYRKRIQLLNEISLEKEKIDKHYQKFVETNSLTDVITNNYNIIKKSFEILFLLILYEHKAYITEVKVAILKAYTATQFIKVLEEKMDPYFKAQQTSQDAVSKIGKGNSSISEININLIRYIKDYNQAKETDKKLDLLTKIEALQMHANDTLTKGGKKPKKPTRKNLSNKKHATKA